MLVSVVAHEVLPDESGAVAAMPMQYLYMHIHKSPVTCGPQCIVKVDLPH